MEQNRLQVRTTETEPRRDPPGQTVCVRVNGEERIVPLGSTVTDLLSELGLEPDRVAVELNREIVRKPQWESTELAAGAALEVVQFVGGG